MGEHRRSGAGSSHPKRPTWNSYFVGVISLAITACLGTMAALTATAGHQPVAITLGALAVCTVVPAALQALGELFVYVMFAALLIGSALLLPALIVSPAARRWTKRRWRIMASASRS